MYSWINSRCLCGITHTWRNVFRVQVCEPTVAYRYRQNMSNWCQVNCIRIPSNCPPDVCHCLWVFKLINIYTSLSNKLQLIRNCIKQSNRCALIGNNCWYVKSFFNSCLPIHICVFAETRATLLETSLTNPERISIAWDVACAIHRIVRLIVATVIEAVSMVLTSHT